MINIFEQVLYKLAGKTAIIDRVDQGIYNHCSLELVGVCNRNAMVLSEQDLYEVLQMIEDEEAGIKRIHEFVIRNPQDAVSQGYEGQHFRIIGRKQG